MAKPKPSRFDTSILHEPHPTDLTLDPHSTARIAQFTDEEITLMCANLDVPGFYTDEEVLEITKLADELERRLKNEIIHNDFLDFCKWMVPEYIVGRHHRVLAKLLMDIATGREDRICVSLPPRHGKSLIISTLFPAWFLGRNPTKKVMIVSHTTDLAVDFGRKVRNLIASAAYSEIFPGVTLAADSKSAGRWSTNHGGEFYAAGVGSSLAGRGADLLIVDDPHSEQDILNGNFEAFARAYEWFTFGARTRLMPGGRVAIVATRWHLDDLIGKLTREMAINDKADQYHVVEFPAILDVAEKDAVGNPTGRTTEKALWPEFFDLEALHRTKASMPTFQCNAQYQQQPTSEEGAIVKREWWQIWGKEETPKCEYVIVTLDAAAETHNRADFTGITTWGVFFNNDTHIYNIILLDAIQERYEFPELKKKAMAVYKQWEPDSFIVEKKSAGAALYQEMRRTGLPVSEYTPTRGTTSSPNTKHARLNSVTDIVASGVVWVPSTRWAEVLVEEVAAFPFGSHDDLVDCFIMAMMRFRNGGFIRLPTDEPDEVHYFKQRKGTGRGYY
jgi:predicted phage terminase large subunit-like protein